MRKTVLLFLSGLLGAVMLWLPAVSAAQVVLSAATSPATGTSGVTTVSVTGTGFPSGTIPAANVTVTLTPSGGSAVTTTATAVTVVKGTKETVSFLVPGTINVSASTAYAVTIAGSTSTGTTFSSSNSANLNVVSPLLASLSPTSGSLGETLTVVLTGKNTTFVQGTTQVTFGAGISVGGAAEGAYGPVTVTSATKATATIAIDDAAAVGAQTVTAVTGSQTVSLANGFTILTPSITSVSPTSASLGESATVVIIGKNTNFVQGTTQVSFGAGISVGGESEGAFGPVTVSSATKATASIVIDGATAAGTRTVTAVTGSQSVSFANGFTVLQPYISALSPSTLLQGETHAVTITGKYTNFVQGTTQVSFGPGISVGGAVEGAYGPVTVSSATKATATVFVDNAAAVGTRAVTAITGTQTASSASGFTVKIDSTPPVAVPGGPYSAQLPAAVQFNGSKSYDPTNKKAVLTYNWNFGDGTANGTGATPTHTYAAAGTYNGTLIVTNSSTFVSSLPAGFVVTITSSNQPPTAVAGGPYTEQLPAAVQLDGSGSSDPNTGATLTYSWNFGDGTANGSGVKPTHTYATPGTYNGTLTVSDNFGLTSAPSPFTVAVTGVAPTAVPGGPYTEQLPAAVQLNGSGSTDPYTGATLTYSWNFGDGTANGTGVSPAHTYATVGTFNGTLTVTDNFGSSSAVAPFKVTVTANPPNAVPGGPYSEQLPAVLQLDGSLSTDPNTGATLTYSWNFGDGTNGTGVKPTHTYAKAGTYSGTLTVSDNFGLTSSPAGFTVTVTALPVAVPGGPYSVQLPAAVQFNGSASSDQNTGATLTFDWNYGDGTPDGSGAQPTHTYAVAGTFNGTLTVKDNFGFASAPAPFVANVAAAAPPPQITISSPTPLSVFNASGNPVTVKGTVDNANDTLTVNGVATANSGGSFSATITLREGQNILTVTATDTAGNVGTASETVTLNTTPPQLGILAPSNNAVLTSSTVNVAGNVNEQVPGTINAQQVTVMVNGIAATVSNRTFSVANIPLVQGQNVITAVATDPAGNTSQTSITVTYMGTIPVQTILKLSGDGQTGAISTTLPQPLVIEVVNSNGAAVPNQQVNFSVIKSDGVLTSSTQQGQQVTAVTDQNGQASVQLQLGTRVGVGNNQVGVTATGYTGEAVFSANSTIGAAAKILVEMGDAQTGVIGTALASPLVIGVFDAGGNPVPYQAVTFTVTTGGGQLNGSSTLQVSTDVNGMASAVLTLGQQEGTSNNVVTADFAGDTGPAASFVSSGQVGGPPTVTSISGLVEDDSNTPVPGATITLEGTNYTAVSDVNGNFLISPAPIGTFLLQVNGHTSTRTDATFPTLAYSITTVSGINNTLGMPVCLPPLDPTSVQTYSPSSTTPLVLQMTGVPGYVFTVAPGSVFNPDGTAYSGPLSLSQVHADRVPMAPPHGSLPLMAGTLQPPGLHFNPPVQTQFPNVSGLAPGTVLDIFSYDHDQMDWVSQGPARVSADGSVINSDPGFGISKSGWHFPPPPPPPPKCASACTTKNPCKTSACVNGACVESNANEGGDCSDGTSNEQCGTNGKCKSGACTFDSTATNGQSCTPDDKCVVDATCQNGTCSGTPYDVNSTYASQQSFSLPDGLTQGAAEFVETFSHGIADLEPINLQYQTQAQNCCTQESGQMPLGKVSSQGTVQLAANVAGVPVWPGSFNIELTVVIPFLGEVDLKVQEGAFFGGEISVNGTVGYVANACEEQNNCAYGQVNLAIEPSIYLITQQSACVEIYGIGKTCQSAGIKGGIKIALNGGIRENTPDQCTNQVQGFGSIERPTIYLTGSIDSYSISLQWQPPISFVPGWTCAWPAGPSGQICMANPF